MGISCIASQVDFTLFFSLADLNAQNFFDAFGSQYIDVLESRRDSIAKYTFLVPKRQ